MPSARSILLQNSKNHLAILRLIVLRSNLQISASNFTRRDLYLENIKFDSNLRRDGAKFNLRIAQQPLTCSGVGEGLGEEGATLLK